MFGAEKGKLSDRIYDFPNGIGDGIMATAVAAAYFERFHAKMRIGHKNSELFENNPHVICYPEFSVKALLENQENCLRKAAAQGFKLITVSYLEFQSEFNRIVNFSFTKKNFIARLGERVGLSGAITCCPNLYLTDEELSFGNFFENQVVVISQGIQRYKTWPLDRMQKIISALPDVSFIQLGAPEDLPLQGVKRNLCGKLSLRQSAAVLAHSRLFIGPIGALMHMARAVDCPGIVLSSSAEPLALKSYYPEFVFIEAKSPCSLCADDRCNVEVCRNPDLCMCDIAPQKVEDILRKKLAAPKEALPRHREVMHADPAEDLTDFENQYRKIIYGRVFFDIVQKKQYSSRLLPFVFNESVGAVLQYKVEHPCSLKAVRIRQPRKISHFCHIMDFRIERILPSGERLIEMPTIQRPRFALSFFYKKELFFWVMGSSMIVKHFTPTLELRTGDTIILEVRSVHRLKVAEMCRCNCGARVKWAVATIVFPLSHFLDRCMRFFCRKVRALFTSFIG